MRISELTETAGVGLVVPGVNMPKGMHPDEIKRQAAKFGNLVSKDGVPPTAKTNGSDALEEKKKKPKPTKPDLWSRAKAEAKKKFDVYPSAYANAWAAKWYKGKGGGWRMG
jgi:hypothetical protein